MLNKPLAEFNDPPIQNTQQGGMSILYAHLLTPYLRLLELYLTARNGTKRTLENQMHEFSKTHPYVFKTIALMDFAWLTVYLVILVVVVLRGLGILNLQVVYPIGNS